MAVIYTATMMVILIVALKHISPTQLVARGQGVQRGLGLDQARPPSHLTMRWLGGVPLTSG
jgi:hypothetical protein